MHAIKMAQIWIPVWFYACVKCYGLYALCFEPSISAGMGNPTSIDFVATDLHQMVAAYTTAKTIVYDLETAKPVLNLDSGVTYGQLWHCPT